MTHHYKVHPNVAKLLDHYFTNGKIGLQPITLPGPFYVLIFLLSIFGVFEFV